MEATDQEEEAPEQGWWFAVSPSQRAREATPHKRIAHPRCNHTGHIPSVAFPGIWESFEDMPTAPSGESKVLFGSKRSVIIPIYNPFMSLRFLEYILNTLTLPPFRFACPNHLRRGGKDVKPLASLQSLVTCPPTSNSNHPRPLYL